MSLEKVDKLVGSNIAELIERGIDAVFNHPSNRKYKFVVNCDRQIKVFKYILYLFGEANDAERFTVRDFDVKQIFELKYFDYIDISVRTEIAAAELAYLVLVSQDTKTHQVDVTKYPESIIFNLSTSSEFDEEKKVFC